MREKFIFCHPELSQCQVLHYQINRKIGESTQENARTGDLHTFDGIQEISDKPYGRHDQEDLRYSEEKVSLAEKPIHENHCRILLKGLSRFGSILMLSS